MNMNGIDKIYTLTEACQALGISPQTIRRAVARGQIKCIYTPGGWRRFPKSEIDRILDTNLEHNGTIPEA